MCRIWLLIFLWLRVRHARACNSSLTLSRCPFETGPHSGQRAAGAAAVFIDCVVREKRPHDRSSIIQTIRIARLFNPSMPIFLVMENRTATELDMLCNFNIHVRTCSCLTDSEDERVFNKVYYHSSVNIIDKERFCFTRFMMLKQLIAQESLQEVLFVDADIFLSHNIAERLKLKVPVQVRIPFPSATYLSMWTASAVSSFVDFTIAFYQRPIQLIVSDISQYGSGKFTSTDPKFVAQFSDMNLLRVFLDRHKVVSQVDNPSTTDLVRAGKGELTAAISLRVAFQEQCICCGEFEDFAKRFAWQQITINGQAVQLPLFRRNNSTHSFLAIHFQGVPCKRVLSHFAEQICPFNRQLIGQRMANTTAA